MSTTEEPPPQPEGMSRFLVNVTTGACVGAVFGSIQSAWLAPHRMTDGIEVAVDALPSFRQMWKHVGGNAMLLSGVAATYTLSESLAASVRGNFDIYTTMSGAFGAGFFIGSRTLNLANAFFYGFGYALCGAGAHLSGGSPFQEPHKRDKLREYSIITPGQEKITKTLPNKPITIPQDD